MAPVLGYMAREAAFCWVFRGPRSGTLAPQHLAAAYYMLTLLGWHRSFAASIITWVPMFQHMFRMQVGRMTM